MLPKRPRRQLDRAGQIAHLRRFLGWLIPVALIIGLAEVGFGSVFGTWQSTTTGSMLVAYASYLVYLRRALDRIGPEGTAFRLAGSLFVVVTLAGALQPSGREVVSMAALLPIAVAMPYVSGRGMQMLMAVGWLIAVGALAVGEFLPVQSALPPLLSSLFRIGSLGVILGLVLVLLGQSATRIQNSADDLASLAEMSSDLARTLDPKEVGDLMARHLSEAVDADEGGICFWDRAADTVLTYGYYPPHRRTEIAEVYSLDDYPETRRVLESGMAVTLSDTDPTADQHEIDYLRSIDQHSMAMLPLVAKGRVLGVVELTSADPERFDERRLSLARTLTGEAALALENAVLHDELRQMAFHDPLTGLANRTLFRDRVQAALGRVAGTSSKLAVMFLDIDDFKTVNDRHGHPGGDTLLVAVGERLRASLRPSDLAARLGGDEFAVLLEDVEDDEIVASIGERIIGSLGQPFVLGWIQLRVTASLGIAVATGGAPGASTADELLRAADLAMYEAKTGGKNQLATRRLVSGERRIDPGLATLRVQTGEGSMAGDLDDGSATEPAPIVSLTERRGAA